jgi:hypothetical protein
MNNFWFPDLNYDIPFSQEPKSKYVSFWKNEINKFQNGFYIADGQVHIGGWLYWHTVYWNIELDILLQNGESFKGEGVPYFRDLEWEIQDNLKRCVIEKRGFSWIGSRGPGKSYVIASIGGMYYTAYHDTQIVVGCSNSGFSSLLTQKIDYGLTRLPRQSLYKHRVLSDWNKTVMAGVKVEGIRTGSNSRFEIKNYEEGNNPTAASGTRPKIHIIDEQGELDNIIACYDAGKQCWYNDYGQFAIPILAGTGGNMNKGRQAAQMFLNPKAHNLLEFDDIYENRKNPIGYFTPVTKARNEYKEPWSLYRYLVEKQGRTDLKPHPDLERITILVSNEEKCYNEFVKPRREMAALSHDGASLTSEIAFYPMTPSEAFTIIGNNQFPVELAKRHRDFLISENIKGQSVTLKRMPDGKVVREFCDDNPISTYPVKAHEDNTGATVIFEEPILNAPEALYIAGADPYAHDDSTTSTSIGVLYIYKRMLSVDDTYVDEIVAYIAGRPPTRKMWHERAELLMDYYNAICMPENETQTFIQYFDEKNCSYKLADGLQLLKEVSPNSDVKRTKGLPPTPPMIKYCNDLVKDYCLEDICVGSDLETGEPIYKKGIVRIKDIMLLEELIQWQPGANCDRLVAFRHVLAYARSLMKYGTPEDYELSIQNSSNSNSFKRSSIFVPSASYFNNKRKSLL